MNSRRVFYPGTQRLDTAFYKTGDTFPPARPLWRTPPLETFGPKNHRPHSSAPARSASCSRAFQVRSMGVNVVSRGSPSRIRRVLRISLGMTTRPRSSMRRTMPVAFITCLLSKQRPCRFLHSLGTGVSISRISRPMRRGRGWKKVESRSWAPAGSAAWRRGGRLFAGPQPATG